MVQTAFERRPHPVLRGSRRSSPDGGRDPITNAPGSAMAIHRRVAIALGHCLRFHSRCRRPNRGNRVHAGPRWSRGHLSPPSMPGRDAPSVHQSVEAEDRARPGAVDDHCHGPGSRLSMAAPNHIPTACRIVRTVRMSAVERRSGSDPSGEYARIRRRAQLARGDPNEPIAHDIPSRELGRIDPSASSEDRYKRWL
jgi:hypothetical protein